MNFGLGGAFGVIVIVKGYGTGVLSSNPKQSC